MIVETGSVSNRIWYSDNLTLRSCKILLWR